ncbi:reverse transcriptase family protein [Dactylosporangium sp. NPDC049140]|uniref:reverse transcriptase family protein n=1 Tax=Dactylosporangium sp. NPDC049140 TaxID=3155647 RepID=UPI0033D61FE9
MTSGRAAHALAHAFLAAADWSRPVLLAAGSEVVGRRPRWMGPLVTAVLRGYRERPADRPRELAGFLAAQLPPRVPARIVVRRAVPTRVVRMRWDTPPLDDLAALAEWLELDGDRLDWFADRREINRKSSAERLRHYRYTWIGSRLIEAPKPALRGLQRRLLDELLGRVPVHPAAHGFVPGRSVHTFAAPHAGRALVVRLDLAAFFPSIAVRRVYGLFRTIGYPEPVAHTLAALCTTSTPFDVARSAVLRAPHLPQGAPTSPALANLCVFRLDRRLTGLAAAFGARYTRYADDLAFSGSFRPSPLIEAVTAVVADEGFRVNPAKTRVRGRGDRQRLAGLVVNDSPAVARAEYDRLRAVLHSAARDGLEAANRDGHPDFAAHLAGRIAWVGAGRPARAAKLRELYRAVAATDL